MDGNILISNIYTKEIYFMEKQPFTYGELET